MLINRQLICFINGYIEHLWSWIHCWTLQVYLQWINLFFRQFPREWLFHLKSFFWRRENIFLSPQFLFIQTLLIKWECGPSLGLNFFNTRPKLDFDSSSSPDHKSTVVVQKGKSAVSLPGHLLFALQITGCYKELIDTGVHNFVAWINVTSQLCIQRGGKLEKVRFFGLL